MNEDNHLPTVETAFIVQQIIDKYNNPPMLQVGSTKAFILPGDKPIIKRLITLREINEGELDYNTATSIAINHKFIGALVDWFVVNKNWKDGAYVVVT